MNRWEKRRLNNRNILQKNEIICLTEDIATYLTTSVSGDPLKQPAQRFEVKYNRGVDEIFKYLQQFFFIVLLRLTLKKKSNMELRFY